MELRDGMGRKIDYLRISVTDKCNNRCIYCIPENGVELFPHEKILRLEELSELTERFARLLGINKVRLTGGEPLVRRNIEGLVGMLNDIQGIDDLAMTTNGNFLEDKAVALWEAGLKRLNVSLDSLDPDRYREITGAGELNTVLDGLDAARDIGFSPIKINTVLLPGFNEENELVEWANVNGFRPRFIELMPHFQNKEWRVTGQGARCDEIIARLGRHYRIVEDTKSLAGENGVHVRRFCVPDRDWVFEIIPGVSSPFCGNCNRLRIDCTGELRMCLYSNNTIQVRPLLDYSDDEFVKAIREFVSHKTERPLDHIGSSMSAIGG